MKLKSFLYIILLSYASNLWAINYRPFTFLDLSQKLGYPNESFFGASEEDLLHLENYFSKEDPFYIEINNYLRFYPSIPYDWYSIGPDEASEIVKSIDQIFKRVPLLPEELVLFRGVNLGYRNNESFPIGFEFTEKGFISTSTSFNIAQSFAIKIHQGQTLTKKALFVLYQNMPLFHGILIDQNEDEVLLEHNQKLKVMAVKRPDPRYEIYLIQMCNNKCAPKMNQDILTFWKHFK